jgi:hypothetical protein
MECLRSTHLERRVRIEMVEEGCSTATTPTDLEKRQQIRNRRDLMWVCHWTALERWRCTG